jgi:glycosyltransferase involved in cell wall biosynthesis
MKVALVEAFFTGSHKRWAEEMQTFSSHKIDIFSLKGNYWKWRMHGGAITLANQFLEKGEKYDLILATDMMDLALFKSLISAKHNDTPIALYFHENQLCYPWSETDRDVQKNRDSHYSFINFSSALVADKVLFNSEFHKNAFFGALPNFLKGFPDYNELDSIKKIEKKSEVLHLRMDLKKFDKYKTEQNKKPLILWNHRWEYDKNPTDFFKALYRMQEKNLEFEVVVLGENFRQIPEEFEIAKEKLKDKIVFMGFAQSFEDYASWLWKAHILPVTSNQDFFGGSVIEAIYCNCYPILPDRLAYPEHLPNHPHLYFNSFDELCKKLEHAILDFSELENLNSSVKHYDWKEIIKEYDKKLEQIKKP